MMYISVTYSAVIMNEDREPCDMIKEILEDNECILSAFFIISLNFLGKHQS